MYLNKKAKFNIYFSQTILNKRKNAYFFTHIFLYLTLHLVQFLLSFRMRSQFFQQKPISTFPQSLLIPECPFFPLLFL